MPVYKLIECASAGEKKYPPRSTSATSVKKKPITKLSWLNFSNIAKILEEDEVENDGKNQKNNT